MQGMFEGGINDMNVIEFSEQSIMVDDILDCGPLNVGLRDYVARWYVMTY